VSISIPVAKAARLPSPMTSGPGEGSSDASDTKEVLQTGIGSLPLAVILIITKRVTIIDIIGSWAFLVILLSEVAEWSIVLLTLVTKDGTAEKSIKDKEATPVSRAKWSVTLLTVVKLTKEGFTKDEGAKPIGRAEWSVMLLSIAMLVLLTKEGFTKDKGATPIGRAEWSVTLLTVAMLALLTKEGSTKDEGAPPISGVEGGSMGTSSIGTTLAT